MIFSDGFLWVSVCWNLVICIKLGRAILCNIICNRLAFSGVWQTFNKDVRLGVHQVLAKNNNGHNELLCSWKSHQNWSLSVSQCHIDTLVLYKARFCVTYLILHYAKHLAHEDTICQWTLCCVVWVYVSWFRCHTEQVSAGFFFFFAVPVFMT